MLQPVKISYAERPSKGASRFKCVKDFVEDNIKVLGFSRYGSRGEHHSRNSSYETDRIITAPLRKQKGVETTNKK